MGLYTDIPKGWVTSIRVPYGPLEGKLASPCLCGYPTDLEQEELHLIQWDQTGQLMFCHPGCIVDPPGEDDDA